MTVGKPRLEGVGPIHVALPTSWEKGGCECRNTGLESQENPPWPRRSRRDGDLPLHGGMRNTVFGDNASPMAPYAAPFPSLEATRSVATWKEAATPKFP